MQYEIIPKCALLGACNVLHINFAESITPSLLCDYEGKANYNLPYAFETKPPLSNTLPSKINVQCAEIKSGISRKHRLSTAA